MSTPPDTARHGAWHRALRLLTLAAPVAVAVHWRRGARLAHALEQSRAALHATQQRLDAIVDRAPVGIVQTDLAGRVQLANRRYCCMVGRSAEHLRSICLLDLTHPEDRAAHAERHAAMLADGRPFQLETRLVHADESPVWVISHLAVTHDLDGRPMHVVAAVQDISHRRQAEAALHAMHATLERRVAETVAERVALTEDLHQAQRMEVLGQLAGGVAHDFNNVLQAIAGGARLIQKRPNDPATVERLAGLVVDASERGAAITARLLSFARRGPLQPGHIDLAALLDELRTIMAASLGSGIDIQVDVVNGLPPVMADRSQLETVLLTLVANARDSMPEDAAPAGGRRLNLSATDGDGPTAGLPPGHYVKIAITDNGTGMGPDALAHATEPFFSTKPRGRGTGLGLAMARGFAEQSGGCLSLRSRAGLGTTVTIMLPAAPPAGTPSSDDDAVPAPGPVRIILVDDDEEVRELLAEILTGCGYVVSSHGSAASALAELNVRRAALLVTDFSMPGMDGLSLIREAQRRHPGLPAMLLTGYGGEDVALAAGRVTGGRIALLQKPVRGAELAERAAILLRD